MYYIDSVEVKTPEELAHEEEFQKQVDSTIKNTKSADDEDDDDEDL